MPPTVSQNAVEREKRVRTGERRSDLVSRVKYCNTLPDIPFDPKFINYPFPPNRYVQYKPTSLEKNYRYEVLTEHDLGVTIDLINPDVYISAPDAELHITDERLLEDDILTPQAAKRSRHHHVNVSWLRRTEYISTETTRYQPQSMEKIEATVGYAAKKRRKVEENFYTDRDSQIEAIENTFKDVKQQMDKHYSKPGVTAVEEFPIFPDFALWKYPCAQVIFDSDPAPAGISLPAQLEGMSQAMIRGVMDESGEQFVAYFLPTEETLEKRKKDQENCVDYVDEEEYDYVMAREYNWNVKNKASKGYEENYFFLVRSDGVYYNELETRVHLSKRRARVGRQPNTSRLVVTHRPLNAQEHKTQVYRERMLEPPGEDEEDEDDDENELQHDNYPQDQIVDQDHLSLLKGLCLVQYLILDLLQQHLQDLGQGRTHALHQDQSPDQFLVQDQGLLLEVQRAQDQALGLPEAHIALVIHLDLGTTRKKAGSGGFVKVDKDYVYSCAQLLKQYDCKQFHIVTSSGANAKSNFLYMRTKGEVENLVQSLGFSNLFIYHPSLLLCDRQESRPLEWCAQVIARGFDWKNKVSISTEVVARAMVVSTFSKNTDDSPVQIFENAQINKLGFE